jgi:hypothetical protein
MAMSEPTMSIHTIDATIFTVTNDDDRVGEGFAAPPGHEGSEP